MDDFFKSIGRDEEEECTYKISLKKAAVLNKVFGFMTTTLPGELYSFTGKASGVDMILTFNVSDFEPLESISRKDYPLPENRREFSDVIKDVDQVTFEIQEGYISIQMLIKNFYITEE